MDKSYSMECDKPITKNYILNFTCVSTEGKNQMKYYLRNHIQMINYERKRD